MTDPDAARLAAEHFGWHPGTWMTVHGEVDGWHTDGGSERIAIDSDGEVHVFAEAAEAMALELIKAVWYCDLTSTGWVWHGEYEGQEGNTFGSPGTPENYRLATLRAFAAMLVGWSSTDTQDVTE